VISVQVCDYDASNMCALYE